jgi:regulator of PEP synthase PpsR (kinase-PPPase family)
VGRFSDVSKSKEYHDRIEAINFSLAHDDGQSNRDLEQADVILVGREPQRQDAHLALPGHAARA